MPKFFLRCEDDAGSSEEVEIALPVKAPSEESTGGGEQAHARAKNPPAQAQIGGASLIAACERLAVEMQTGSAPDVRSHKSAHVPNPPSAKPEGVPNATLVAACERLADSMKAEKR